VSALAVVLLAPLSPPAAASHVTLEYFGLQCVTKTHDGPIWGFSRDEPYVVTYAVVLNGRDYLKWGHIRGPFTGVDSGDTMFGGWGFAGGDDPQNVIWLVAVMEHDQSHLTPPPPGDLGTLVFQRLNATVDSLRAASANRATWVARLIDEMDRALRDGAVSTARGGDPDDLIARPQEVPLNRLDFDSAGGGAHLIKRVHHVGGDGHYVTLHRLRPR
jgi:hypothetical protein